MNRYHCFLIIGSELKPITIEADMVHLDSTCATRFHKKVKVIGIYGTPEISYDVICQYPTDRFIIESVEEVIDNID